MGGGAENIKFGVAHHHGVINAPILFQQKSDDLTFGGTALVEAGTADQIKVFRQIKMLQYLDGRDLRLGGGYEETVPLGFQRFQQLPDAGVGMIFIFSDGHIAASENVDGLLSSFLWDAEFNKSIPQGRPHEYPHFLPGRHGKPKPLQGHLGAVDDALPGISEGSVQIK